MNTTVQKKVNNAAYRTTIAIGASRWKQLAWYFTNILFFQNPLNPLSSLKVSLLKGFGARLGKGVLIKQSVNIKYPWKLQVGDHTWIGESVWIDNLSEVTIGSNVTLSQGCLLLTGSHDASRETFDFLSQPITLEDGVWIGAKAVVAAAAAAAPTASWASSSVAESDLEPYTIYKG